MAAHITYLSEAGLTDKFGRRLQDREAKSFGFDADFQVESYLRHQGSTFVDRFELTPVVVLACFERWRAPHISEGGSVFPACQNLLLAARALGYGGVLTMWHGFVEHDLRRVLRIPGEVVIAATITLGVPEGGHGPVRRRPLADVVHAAMQSAEQTVGLIDASKFGRAAMLSIARAQDLDAIVTDGGLPPGVALAAGLLAAFVVALIPGLVNGLLIARLRVPGFIGTLGTIASISRRGPLSPLSRYWRIRTPASSASAAAATSSATATSATGGC